MQTEHYEFDKLVRMTIEIWLGYAKLDNKELVIVEEIEI